MRSRFELEIYSDFNCTWCYFDKGIIKRLAHEYDIYLVWRAFPLHPDIPEGGLFIKELFGNSLPVMNDKIRQLEKKASELGLPLAKRVVISDSRLSQELAKWAESIGICDGYRDAIYEAYFACGLDISDQSVLLDVVESLHLSRDEALSVLQTGAFSRAVDEDWERSEALHIMVAPTYVLNNERLMGSQSYEKLEKFMFSNGVPKRAGA